MMEGIKNVGQLLEVGGGSRLWQVSVGLLVVIVCWIADVIQRKRDRVHELDSWIAQARKERDDKQFHILSKESPPSNMNLSATETTQKIQANQLNMVDNLILLAHRCRRYGRDQDKVNAVTQELYDEAHEQAMTLQNSSTKQKGLLYGVPISVKDCIAIKGTLSTGGLACRLKSPSLEDALIIKVIKHAGAIPLVRGNTVQTMMLAESVNRIWGQSRNPWDLLRTPGGSSGGDAALVAMECVPLAIGSDVAGSLRIPAAFCGIVGFKPTSTRLSMKGNMKPRKVRNLMLYCSR
jgi:Asp-tRNA(Asn)/Glu-tRNA(Gln) amidotransferase A subunit family amidase